MRIAALTPYPEPAPSTRFRVAQFREPLAREGVNLEIHPFFSKEEYAALYSPGRWIWKSGVLVDALRRRSEQLKTTSVADLVLVHRDLAPVLPGHFLGLLDSGFPPVVFDFDDAVFLPPRGGNLLLKSFRRSRTSTAGLCGRAGLVLAGNSYLADFAVGARGRREGVEVLPTVIDTDAFVPDPKKRGASNSRDPNALPVVGWIGTHSTLPYLESISEPLAQVAERIPFRLLVICNRAPRMGPGVEVEFRPWSGDRELSDLADMDVGVYPLPEDRWTLGKCGFKAIQYMACGIPLVASPVGVLRDIVLDGETGFLALGPERWRHTLSDLLEALPRSRAMGAAGRRHVEATYSVTAVLPRLLSLFRALAS